MKPSVPHEPVTFFAKVSSSKSVNKSHAYLDPPLKIVTKRSIFADDWSHLRDQALAAGFPF
jgi:hypothetical protein